MSDSSAPPTDLASLTPEQLEGYLAATIMPNPGVFFGPFFMGYLLDGLLFGVLVMQVTYWASWSRRERTWTKVIAWWAVAATTGTTVYNTYLWMRLFVYNFGGFSEFLKQDWLSWYGTLNLLPVIAVQIFYLERAWKLTNSIWVFVTVIPLMLASIAFSLAGQVILHSQITSVVSADKHIVSAIFYGWLSTCLTVDLILVGFISWGLWKSKTGWSGTDQLINRLVKVSLEAQIPSTLVSLAFLITYSVAKDSTMVVFYEFFLNKTYVVCLFSLLNSRFSLKRDLAGHGENTYKMTGDWTKRSRNQQATVMVSTEVFTEISGTPKHMPVLKRGLNRIPSKEDILEGYEGSELGVKFDDSPPPSSASKNELTWADALKKDVL